VVLERPIGSPSGATALIEDLRHRLPQGAAVYFLRSQGEQPSAAKPGEPASTVADKSMYGLVHVDGVFLQGPGRL
jgi:hypothetical protein